MPPEQDAELVAELFKSAIELAPEERGSFLDERCRSKPGVRGEVESLLQMQSRAEKFMERPALDLAAEDFAREGAFRAGQSVGHYEIVSLIGKGGMGEVYLAQDQQLRRRVALKLVRRGMDTEAIVRRFHQEQQLLAGLNHPNIAQLYDSGITPDGIPFFAMEYVDGTRVDDYCREKELPIEARLELFGKICGAVHYAHQHLVVHRDIKPSNILVTADGEPKLLDFGIAKLLDTVTNAAPEQTVTLQNVMTPEYASPEHVRGEAITTASDVYSLGVLLYELLTGSKPYRFETRTPVEIARIISEQEPSKPSTVTFDGNRKSEIENRKFLRGDLDNIVLMAMRKEPQRRYSSVGHFAGDIRRHLEGLPVRARKDTFAYRSSKFVRRHRVGVAAATLVLVAILAGLLISLGQTRVARRERARAQAVSQFLQTTLFSSSPESAARLQKNDATLRDVLDDVSRRLAGGELSNQPEVRAELQRLIGGTYLGIGLMDVARQNLMSALEAQTRIYGEEHPETLKTRIVLANNWFLSTEADKAESFYRQYLPMIRVEAKKGRIEAVYLGNVLHNMALAQRRDGDSRQAEALMREILSLDYPASTDAKSNRDVHSGILALTLADQGKFDEAEQILRAKVAALRQEQNGGLVGGQAMCANLSILGNVLLGKGEYVEAEAISREAEETNRKVYDATNMQVGDALRLEAQVLYHLGKYGEAETKIDECLTIYRKWVTPKYINFATAIMVQGMIYSETNRVGAAEELLREAVRIRREHTPKTHFLRATAEGQLGEFLTTQKRFAEAELFLLESYESFKASQAPGSTRTRTALERLIVFYESSGRSAEADKYKALLVR